MKYNLIITLIAIAEGVIIYFLMRRKDFQEVQNLRIERAELKKQMEREKKLHDEHQDAMREANDSLEKAKEKLQDAENEKDNVEYIDDLINRVRADGK